MDSHEMLPPLLDTRFGNDSVSLQLVQATCICGSDGEQSMWSGAGGGSTGVDDAAAAAVAAGARALDPVLGFDGIALLPDGIAYLLEPWAEMPPVPRRATLSEGAELAARLRSVSSRLRSSFARATSNLARKRHSRQQFRRPWYLHPGMPAGAEEFATRHSKALAKKSKAAVSGAHDAIHF